MFCPFISTELKPVKCYRENCMLYSYGKCAFANLVSLQNLSALSNLLTVADKIKTTTEAVNDLNSALYTVLDK